MVTGSPLQLNLQEVLTKLYNSFLAQFIMIHYLHCPICLSENIAELKPVKDFSVSGETFKLMHCAACDAKFTQDVPGQEEIGPYYASEAYVSHSDSQKGIINSLYHIIRKRTLKHKRKLVSKFTNKTHGSILDIGCGTGAFLDEMKTNGWQTTGLEPDATARENAVKLHRIQPLLPEVLFSLPKESFDAITLWHVLEHVHDVQVYMKQCDSLLKEKGKLFIAVPNYKSHDAEVYGDAWAAYDVPRHLYHFTVKSMEAILKLNGLRLQEILPMWFDSFYVSMLSEKYKNNKSNLLNALLVGVRSNLKARAQTEKCSSIIYVIEKA